MDEALFAVVYPDVRNAVPRRILEEYEVPGLELAALDRGSDAVHIAGAAGEPDAGIGVYLRDES